MEDHNGVKSEYFAKARSVRVGAAQAKRKAKPQTRIVLPQHIEQTQAKQYFPDAASCWQSHTRGERNAHYPNCKRVAASFDKHGSSNAALRACL